MTIRTIIASVMVLGAAHSGCASSTQSPAEAPETCRKGPVDDIEMGLETAGEGVEAGAETGVAGVKQFGRAVGGWVEDGSSGAEREWEEGEDETIAEANEGADEVEGETLPVCPPSG